MSTELKKILLKKCKEQLGGMVSDFKKEIEEAQQSANDYGTPRDRYDSYRTQMLRKRDMFAQQLAKVNVQVDVLDKIDPDRVCKKVEFGALVITSAQQLFISTGLGKIVVKGEEYYAISAAVPIFQKMEGKKAGEEFEMNGKTIGVLEVF